MVQRSGPVLEDDPVIVPVPLHWSRLLRRRYNQAALLATQIAKVTRSTHCPDALLRPKRTKLLGGHGREARFAALSGAIVANDRRKHLIQGRKVVIIDDVMTTGATLAAAAEAALSAGARDVCILTLARAVKDA